MLQVPEVRYMYLRTGTGIGAGTGAGTAAGAVYSVQCTGRYSCRCSVQCTVYRASICTPPHKSSRSNTKTIKVSVRKKGPLDTLSHGQMKLDVTFYQPNCKKPIG